MLVLLVVYSCMGMQLYGSAFDFDGEIPRENFDNFVMAFLALFQVWFDVALTQERVLERTGREMREK